MDGVTAQFLITAATALLLVAIPCGALILFPVSRRLAKFLELLFEERRQGATLDQGELFDIFGGITRCDDVAKGMVGAVLRIRIEPPVIIRLTGTKSGRRERCLVSEKARWKGRPLEGGWGGITGDFHHTSSGRGERPGT